MPTKRTGKGKKHGKGSPPNPHAISAGPHAGAAKYLDLKPTAPGSISSKQLLSRKKVLEKSGLSQGFHFSLSYLYQTGVLLKKEQYKDADLYDLVANSLEKFGAKWDPNKGTLRNPKDAKLASDPSHVVATRRATCTDDGYQPIIGAHHSVQFIIPKETNHLEVPMTEHALYLATHKESDVDEIHKVRRLKNKEMEKLKKIAKADRAINDVDWKKKKQAKEDDEKAAKKAQKHKEEQHNKAVRRRLKRMQKEKREMANGGKPPPKPPSSARNARASPPRQKQTKAATTTAKTETKAKTETSDAGAAVAAGAAVVAQEVAKEAALAKITNDNYSDDDDHDDYDDDNFDQSHDAPPARTAGANNAAAEPKTAAPAETAPVAAVPAAAVLAAAAGDPGDESESDYGFSDDGTDFGI